MMRSLYSGVSGLRNHQTRMDVIGNNIANVNTVGFKASRVSFQDMLSQTLQGASGAAGGRGGTNPVQVGMGVGVASIDTIFTDGSFQSTGKQTDLAISGQGFFVLSNGNSQLYSRSGAFDYDTSGNLLVPGTGYKVMGYKADSTGNIDTSQTVQGIQVPVGATMPAKISTKLTYANNLMASAKVLGSPAVIAAATAALTAAQTATKTAALATQAAMALKPTAADTATAAAIVTATAASAAATKAAAVTTPPATATSVLDAVQAVAGGTAVATAANDAAALPGATAATVVAAVNVALAATQTATTATTPATAIAVAQATISAKTAMANEKVALQAVNDASDKSSEARTAINVYDSQGNPYQVSGTFGKIADNQWSFTPEPTVKNSSGQVIANVTASAPITITFNPDGSFGSSTPAAVLSINQTGITPPSPFAGAGAFVIAPDFSAMTQYGSTTTVQATGQDGFASGSLEKTNINTSGVIIGQFNNGQTLKLAQVALASFNNPGGLTKSGESLYLKSTNSGEAQIGGAGAGGRGTFNAGALEMSNVDLAQQFSDMIVTQRGFQANSKIITTTDTMLEELVNLKR